MVSLNAPHVAGFVVEHHKCRHWTVGVAPVRAHDSAIDPQIWFVLGASLNREKFFLDLCHALFAFFHLGGSLLRKRTQSMKILDEHIATKISLDDFTFVVIHKLNLCDKTAFVDLRLTRVVTISHWEKHLFLIACTIVVNDASFASPLDLAEMRGEHFVAPTFHTILGLNSNFLALS